MQQEDPKQDIRARYAEKTAWDIAENAMKKRNLRIILIAISAVAICTIYAAGLGDEPDVKVTKTGDSTFEVSYDGDPSSAGRLINVFAFKSEPGADKDAASIRDENFLDGETVAIGADGTFKACLNMETKDGAVIYLGGEDELLPGGRSPAVIYSVKALPKLTAPALKLSPGKRTYDQVEASWTKVSGASGYYLFSTTNKNKWPDKASVTIKSGSTLKYLDPSKPTGTTVYYKVQAYSFTNDGKTVVGGFSDVRSITPYLKTVTLKSVKAGGKKKKQKVTIRWSSADGANGYYVYRAVKKSKSFKKTAVVKGMKKTSFTDKKVKKKKKYFYKVRPFRTVNGKTVFAAYSNVKSVKVR
jgi:hypothetical protein